VTSVRKYIGWVISVALFVWAIFGLVSILSKLHFAMDAWSWCVARVPISQRPILVEFRHHVSDWVASYRELVHEIAQILHLPRLPQLIYDAVGVVAFSIGRGQWIGRRADMRAADFVLESGELDHLETDDEMLAGLYRRFPLEGLKDKITFLLRQPATAGLDEATAGLEESDRADGTNSCLRRYRRARPRRPLRHRLRLPALRSLSRSPLHNLGEFRNGR
jgi:hypothetical protein